MAKRKRRVKPFRLLILILVVIAIVIGIFFGVRALFKKPEVKPNDNPQGDVIKPNNDSKKETLSVDLIDYQVYKSEEFNFVIANIRFMDESKISYDLANLTTNQNYKLSESKEYADKLQSSGIFTDKLDVVFEVKSDASIYAVNLLIPFDANSEEITVKSTVGEFKINLNRNEVDISKLKYTANSEIEDGKNYSIVISEGYDVDDVYKKGVEGEYGTSFSVFYAFDIKIDRIKEGIVLEKAVLTTDDKYEALDERFYSDQVRNENMISAQLKAGNTYTLYFELFKAPENNETIKGNLSLKFSESDKVIDLEASLK